MFIQDIAASNLMVRIGEYHVLNRNEAHPHIDRKQFNNSSVVQWPSSPVVQQSNGPVVQQSSSPVVQQCSSSVVQQFSSPVAQQSSSPVLQWSSSPVVQQFSSSVQGECFYSENSSILESSVQGNFYQGNFFLNSLFFFTVNSSLHNLCKILGFKLVPTLNLDKFNFLSV